VRQSLLEAFNVEERLQKTCILLTKELNILELENQIHSQVQQEVDKSQREYFLREQLKAIQHELGETDPTMRENEELREKILSSGMPEEVKARADKELDRLNSTPSMAPDGGVIRAYLDWLVSLPWNKATVDQLDIKEAARILEEKHYGLEKVKERILEYIAVRKLSEICAVQFFASLGLLALVKLRLVARLPRHSIVSLCVSRLEVYTMKPRFADTGVPM